MISILCQYLVCFYESHDLVNDLISVSVLFFTKTVLEICSTCILDSQMITKHSTRYFSVIAWMFDTRQNLPAKNEFNWESKHNYFTNLITSALNLLSRRFEIGPRSDFEFSSMIPSLTFPELLQENSLLSWKLDRELCFTNRNFKEQRRWSE